jgi:serine/threonine protein kinase
LLLLQWRSPEEAKNLDNMSEQTDIYTIGTMFWVILTGRWISDDDVNKPAEKGHKLYIDEIYYKSRSFEEAKLAEIIDRCQEPKPEDRPSIFEIVQELRETLEYAKREADTKL